MNSTETMMCTGKIGESLSPAVASICESNWNGVSVACFLPGVDSSGTGEIVSWVGLMLSDDVALSQKAYQLGW